MGKNKFQDEYYFKHPRTEAQRLFAQSIANNIITMGLGPAGTGKTLFALQGALKLNYRKIYYVRNNCFTDGLGSKGRGELPGSVLEKALPLLGPVADNLFELVAEPKARFMLEKGIIEPLYYEDLRGRSFKNAFIIADEAQNVSSKGIKTLLTRISEGTKLILIGDCAQKDTSLNIDNGLLDAKIRLAGLPFLNIVQFSKNDIQRSPILKEILMRYD